MSSVQEAQVSFVTYAAALQKRMNDLREELNDELNKQTLLPSRVATLIVQEMTSPGSLKIHADQNRRLREDIEAAAAFMESITQKDGSVHDENQVQNYEQISGRHRKI